MSYKTVEFTVNGRHVVAEVKPKKTLVRFLREELGLAGAKNGCGTGHCGACTVIVEGEAKKSCVIPISQMQGKQVLTIEGLTPAEGLHPIQEAFLQTGAVQCGFCTPGMIMAVKAFLDKNPKPTVEEIKEGLKGNICRCTGYVKIIDAVMLAARFVKENAAEKLLTGSGLGNSLPDIEGVEKVKGTLLYADDRSFPGMLHGKVLWAAYPHAELVSINTEKAKSHPGVTNVLTWEDVPGRNGFGSLKPDQPILCREKVRYMGDPVAFVLAESVQAAEEAVKLIEVKYNALPGVYSPQDGLTEDVVKIHPEGNICKHLVHQVGDVREAKGKAEVVVAGQFQTPFVEHAYLEPEAGIGLVDAEGILTIYAPTQFPFEVRKQLQEVLNLPEEQIRVVVTPLGGGFGGKCDATVEFLLAVAAYRTKRPVKLTLTREESLRMSTKRHPYWLDYEVGATQEGKLLYVDAKLLSDAGPYTNLSPRVIDQACIFSCGPYVVPNLRVEGWAVYTNNANSSAFRGFGINQAAVAIEALLDELARELKIDPFELRLRNALDVGDETISGEVLKASVAIKDTIRQAKEALEWELPKYRALYQGSTKKLGIGVASGFKNVGAGKGKVDDAGAVMELGADGSILVRASAVDMGQGIRTTLVQIAAETLGVTAEQIKLTTGDTMLTPKHGGAVGERQTLISGNAMLRAAESFKSNLLEHVAKVRGLKAEALDLKGDLVLSNKDEAVTSLAELAGELSAKGETLKAEYYYVAPKTFALADKEARAAVPKEEYRNYPAYAYTTQVAIVEVDEETGETKLLKVIASHDVGRAINPQKIEGQIEGSCSMGQGYALTEEYVVEQGMHKTNNFKKLGVPKIHETPEYEVLTIEDPEPNGPYGAKGISEVATVPITPAILNAIYDAVGVRINQLPATPEKIKAALQNR